MCLINYWQGRQYALGTCNKQERKLIVNEGHDKQQSQIPVIFQ